MLSRIHEDDTVNFTSARTCFEGSPKGAAHSENEAYCVGLGAGDSTRDKLSRRDWE
jgi:hypothetical protein